MQPQYSVLTQRGARAVPLASEAFRAVGEAEAQRGSQERLIVIK